MNRKLLEVIDTNEENAFHTFLLSHQESSVWSKFGKGDDIYIKEIRELIDKNKDKIDYKQIFLNKKILKGFFDPLFTSVDDSRAYYIKYNYIENEKL